MKFFLDKIILVAKRFHCSFEEKFMQFSFNLNFEIIFTANILLAQKSELKNNKFFSTIS